MEGHALKDEANNQLLSLRGTSADGGLCALIQPNKLSEENLNRLNISEEDNPVIVVLH